jgi:hypothetical protein
VARLNDGESGAASWMHAGAEKPQFSHNRREKSLATGCSCQAPAHKQLNDGDSVP